MQASLGELAAQFGCELIGDPSVRVSRVATLANAQTDALSFFANPAYRDALRTTSAAAVIIKGADADDCPVAALISAEPYLTYARVAGLLHPPPEYESGIHPSAVIDASATVARTATIAANAVIGSDGAFIDRIHYRLLRT